MPRKRRVDKTRDGRITNRAVDLFELGLKLRAQQRDRHEIDDVAIALVQALGLGPHQWDPLLDCNDDEPPTWLTDPDKIEDYHNSRQIRLDLEAAMRERRRARHAAPQPTPTPDLPPAA